MSDDPFAFLDKEEETIEDDKGLLAWLPLTLAGLALAGFLAIPILGILRPKTNSSEWADFTQTDPIDVSIEAEIEPNPIDLLLTPSPENSLEDLKSVDETLAGLGIDFVKEPKSVEVPASALISGGRNKRKTNNTPVVDQKASNRIATTKRPVEKIIAAKSNKITKEITIQKGDTLYGIARQTGSTPDEIAKINGINKNQPISVGQRLEVPTIVRPTPQPVQPQQTVARPAQPRITPTRTRQTQPFNTPAQQSPRIVRPTSAPQAPQPYSPMSSAPASIIPGPTAPVVRPTYPNNNSGPNLFPTTGDRPAVPKQVNPLDKYDHAIAYRVQSLDNINRIADAHATTPEELIELNGRAKVKKGEMLVVPVDNCLIKDK